LPHFEEGISYFYVANLSVILLTMCRHIPVSLNITFNTADFYSSEYVLGIYNMSLLSFCIPNTKPLQ